MPVIFEAFRQGGTRRRGGLGIGLDLVKRLTELHDGTVDVFSEGSGYGARFQVRLPFATPPALPPRRAVPSTRLDGRTILVVEDNADRSEERRVGKECRCRWWRTQGQKGQSREHGWRAR